MNRAFAVLTIVIILSSGFCSAQATPASDPQALALVAKAMAALTGGLPVTGVTLDANAISIAGSDYFTGTAILQSKGTTDSRVDLTVNGTTRTEIRTVSAGYPSGSWVNGAASAKAYAQFNCWTGAAWFFPALSSLTQTAANNFFFSYLGQEQQDGFRVEHLRVFQHLPLDTKSLSGVDRLSTTDIYLDPITFLPAAIAFKVRADGDMQIELPMEIRFAKYQSVSGIQVPFHIQRLLNGGLVLDLTVTDAVINPASSTTPVPVQ